MVNHLLALVMISIVSAFQPGLCLGTNSGTGKFSTKNNFFYKKNKVTKIQFSFSIDNNTQFILNGCLQRINQNFISVDNKVCNSVDTLVVSDTLNIFDTFSVP